MQSRRITSSLVGTALIGLLAQTADTQQQNAATATDWPSYRHDESGTGHSPLRQINAGNVASLIRVWTYSLQGEASAAPNAGRGGGAGGVNSQATPIVVNGVMYLPAANRVVALDPESGKRSGNMSSSVARPPVEALAYWPGEGATAPRIIFTAGRRLIALNAKTGSPSAGFGNSGEVDIGVPYNSVPIVHRNVVVVGANTPPGTAGGIGNPRAFDARTGRQALGVQLRGRSQEPGATTHGKATAGRAASAPTPGRSTSPLDDARGLLYLPLASPIAGNYGGDRKGANLFGNSVVAVDVQTGAYKWHFQTIHHDLWDADPPAPPVALRHRPERAHDSRARADHEVWLHVHAESRNRSADLRRRRACRSPRAMFRASRRFPRNPSR